MIKLANTIVYDMHEAAAMLHCHENTIARYIKAGTLRAQKVGRKSGADIVSFPNNFIVMEQSERIPEVSHTGNGIE